MLLAQEVDIKSNLGTNMQFDIGILVGRFAGVGLLIAALAAFAFMVWGGVQWVLAGGDKSKVENARNAITQGLVGLAITASVFAAFRLINYFFGLQININ